MQVAIHSFSVFFPLFITKIFFLESRDFPLKNMVFSVFS